MEKHPLAHYCDFVNSPWSEFIFKCQELPCFITIMLVRWWTIITDIYVWMPISDNLAQLSMLPAIYWLRLHLPDFISHVLLNRKNLSMQINIKGDKLCLLIYHRTMKWINGWQQNLRSHPKNMNIGNCTDKWQHLLLTYSR